MQKKNYFLFLIILLVNIKTAHIKAVEFNWHGLVDIRYSLIDNNKNIDSFIKGDYGKFRFNDSSNISLSQAALSFVTEINEHYNFHLTTNTYFDGVKDAAGITEAFLKYTGLPSENGTRFELRAGILYPKISLENIATAWNSPYTLTYSTINSWIGEEVRHMGIELNIKHQGKFTKSQNDFNASLSFFQNNDTTGALLAWHGWTHSSRQTLWHEKIPLANANIRSSGMPLSEQANASDPFAEIDNQIGYHLNGEWLWKKKIQLSAGYYNNQAKPYIQQNGQYAWRTRFSHLAIKWHLSKQFTLLSQYLSGDTLMQSPIRYDIVNNHFYSAYILLSKKQKDHRFTTRIEKFSVTDNDNTIGDNNDESGHSITLSYAYRLNKNWYLHSEYNSVDSRRPSRAYHNQPIDLVEKQFQLAIRYFF